MAYDINRLRQQSLFNDIMGGGIMGGMGMQPEDPYQQTAPQIPQQQQQPMIPQQYQTAPELPMQQRQTQPTPQLRMPTPTYGLPQQPSSVETDIQGLIDMANKFYTPSTVDRDRFRGLLDSFPERGNPSLARSIVAGGIGIGSKNPLEDMEKYQYAPYYRDVAAWKEKAGPFQQGAQLENTSNNIERQLATTMVSGANTANRNAQLQATAVAKQDELTRSNQAKEEIARQRNAIASAKANGAKFHTEGDRIIAMYPNGRTQDAGPTHNFSPFELEDLRQTGRIAVVEAQGANQQQNNEQTGRDLIIDDDGNTWKFIPGQGWKKQPEGPQGPLTRPGSGGQGQNQMSENDRKLKRLNDIQAAIDYNPNWSKWVDSETGQIEPMPSGGMWGTKAAEKEDYAKFRKFMDPRWVDPNAKQPQSPSAGKLLPGVVRQQEQAAQGGGNEYPDVQIGDAVGGQQQGQKPPNYLSDKRLQLFDMKTGKPILGGDGKPQYIDPTKEQIAAAARAGYLAR